MQNLLMLQHMVFIVTVGFRALSYLLHQVQLGYICTPYTFWVYSHLQGEDILAVSLRKKGLKYFESYRVG